MKVNLSDNADQYFGLPTVRENVYWLEQPLNSHKQEETAEGRKVV
jgi:hypothetical protein